MWGIGELRVKTLAVPPLVGKRTMPVREKTRNDPPMKKQAKGPGMFAKTDSGEKPHAKLLKDASTVGSKMHVGSKKTLTR